MRDTRTPIKEQSRTMELSNRRQRDPPAKKLQKIPKKSLAAVLGSVDDEVSKESFYFSSLSDVVDTSDDCSDVTESLLAPLSPSQSSTTDTFDSSHLSLSSSYEADRVVDLLKGSQFKLIKSPDVDSQSENLTESMTKTRTEGFYPMARERTCFKEILSFRVRVFHVCFALGIIAAFGILFSSSGHQGSYRGPLPT